MISNEVMVNGGVEDNQPTIVATITTCTNYCQWEKFEGDIVPAKVRVNPGRSIYRHLTKPIFTDSRWDDLKSKYL